MFIKKKLIFDRQIRNKNILISGFNFEECLESNEEYFFEYFQYNNSFTTPQQRFSYNKNFIKILKERDKSNTLKFYENKFYDRLYPSLCCIEKVFVNDLDYSFELNNIWKNIF